MKLWRISNYADLKGLGGTITAARWHNKGIPVVYLAESPALAMLEVLVHFELDVGEVPDHFQLLEIDFDGRRGVGRLAEKHLPADWRDNLEYTRTIGDEWLTSMSSVLLQVPSAIVPHSVNYLFNPRHKLARTAKIISCRRHPFDSRLL